MPLFVTLQMFVLFLKGLFAEPVAAISKMSPVIQTVVIAMSSLLPPSLPYVLRGKASDSHARQHMPGSPIWTACTYSAYTSQRYQLHMDRGRR